MCRMCPLATWLAQYPDGVRYRRKMYFVQLADEVAVELKADRGLGAEREFRQIVVVGDVLARRRYDRAGLLVHPTGHELSHRPQGARHRHVANGHDVQAEVEARLRAGVDPPV